MLKLYVGEGAAGILPAAISYSRIRALAMTTLIVSNTIQAALLVGVWGCGVWVFGSVGLWVQGPGAVHDHSHGVGLGRWCGYGCGCEGEGVWVYTHKRESEQLARVFFMREVAPTPTPLQL